MKTQLLLAFTGILFLSACGRLSSFESPNHLRNINSTLYLANGKQFEGKLIIQMGNLFSSNVKLLAEGDSKAMQFPLTEVVGYRVGDDYYALKDRKGGLGTGRHYSFMKRLTPSDSRMHLYEDRQREVTSGKGNLQRDNQYHHEYFLELPTERGLEVYASSASRLVPHFEEKMSHIVGDCLALAQKIINKEDGYFYHQVSFSRQHRAEVLLRIIKEYNQCK